MELSKSAGRLTCESSEKQRTSPSESEFSGKSDAGLDLPPEYCHYRDEGCEFSVSCLDCPFPKCIYDQPGGRQRWLNRFRDRELVKLFAEGTEVKELAERFGVSQRTVQRALGRAKNE